MRCSVEDALLKWKVCHHFRIELPIIHFATIVLLEIRCISLIRILQFKNNLSFLHFFVFSWIEKADYAECSSVNHIDVHQTVGTETTKVRTRCQTHVGLESELGFAEEKLRKS